MKQPRYVVLVWVDVWAVTCATDTKAEAEQVRASAEGKVARVVVVDTGPAPMVTVPEFRVGRTFVRVGDRVHVGPSRPRKRDGFDSTVRRIFADDEGNATGVDVADPNGAVRTVRPARITRKRQAVAELATSTTTTTTV